MSTLLIKRLRTEFKEILNLDSELGYKGYALNRTPDVYDANFTTAKKLADVLRSVAVLMIGFLDVELDSMAQNLYLGYTFLQTSLSKLGFASELPAISRHAMFTFQMLKERNFQEESLLEHLCRDALTTAKCVVNDLEPTSSKAPFAKEEVQLILDVVAPWVDPAPSCSEGGRGDHKTGAVEQCEEEKEVEEADRYEKELERCKAEVERCEAEVERCEAEVERCKKEEMEAVEWCEAEVERCEAEVERCEAEVKQCEKEEMEAVEWCDKEVERCEAEVKQCENDPMKKKPMTLSDLCPDVDYADTPKWVHDITALDYLNYPLNVRRIIEHYTTRKWQTQMEYNLCDKMQMAFRQKDQKWLQELLDIKV